MSTAAVVAGLIGKPLLVRITYVKCGLHRPPDIRKTLKALGLVHLHQSVIHKNIRPIRGMINRVKRYVDVQPIIFQGLPKLDSEELQHKIEE